ncbi:MULTISPECIES: DUF4386 domain-containing protein [unclassified Spirosoma]|uniref:DUF4386 domain-containing protein n=1 Tax=unclassified Spirosoma TaxID=2621999 RepID=UPI00096652F6|nr:MULTISPECIES: DUF4386 domain-containing protein [unclassified Spirosoma]MBN8821818.1 DUF4386 domain-containing protein [Spirosoma sp.]OJW80693.1 MAG: hypothetical protein BGO59_35100 [Spirosoma sp. 48-14]
MKSTQVRATIVGVLFISAAVTAIAGLALYDPILHNPTYILNGSAHEDQVIMGAFFEILLAFSVIGTSISVYPVLKMQNESVALGYVCGRLLEAAIIIIGIISLLTIVSLNHQFATASASDTNSLLMAGKVLVAVHDWTFLFGPNIALGPNTLMLSYLLYKSKLTPRFIPILGFIGGPLIFLSAMCVMAGLYPQISVWGTICAIPVFAFEMSLAVRLVAKGFGVSKGHSIVRLLVG